MNNYQKKIVKYHQDNPAIYKAFNKFTKDVIGSGYNYFSAEMIINRIRWQTMIEAKDKRYKINNGMKPFYSRLFMTKNKKYKQFFKLKPSQVDGIDFEIL